MKIQDKFYTTTSVSEGIDWWRKGKLSKFSVSETGEATALPSSSALSERPEEVRVSARHVGDCGGRDTLCSSEGNPLSLCPEFICRVDVRK